MSEVNTTPDTSEQQPEVEVTEPSDESRLEWCDTTQLKAVVTKGMFVDDGSTFQRSWPKHKVEGGCCAGSKYGPCKPLHKVEMSNLARLLDARWRAPAYLLSYVPTSMPYRLSEEVFDVPGALDKVGGRIEMQLFLVDVDRHDLKPEQVDEWFEKEKPKLEKLRARHGCLAYRSKGGYRILGVLKRPFKIRSKKQIINWKRLYMAWLNYLAREFEIGTDTPADELVDWQRLQRVPHDLRSEDGRPEEREIIGDVTRIGYWDPPLTEGDHEWAANQIRDKKIGSSGPKRKKKIQQAIYTGKTVLRLLLEQRGLVGEEVETGKWNIICPMEAQHSTPNEGEADNDTVLYENGGRFGHLHCSHAGCGHSRYELADWLREFDESDINAARAAAGVRDGRDTSGFDPTTRVNDASDWAEIAEIVAKRLPRYVRYRGYDYLWAGNCYEPLTDEEWSARLRQVCQTLWSVRKDGEGNETPARFKPCTKTDREIAAAMLARPGVILDADRTAPFAIDAGAPDPTDLVFLQNVWVDWFSEEEHAPTDDVFVTNVLNAEWKASNLSFGTRRWKAFLRDVWGDDDKSIALLQEWFGAILCRLTQYHKFFYLKGPKRSGKGTIARVLLRLLGDVGCTFENGGLGGQFDLEKFLGKDVAICPDAVWSGVGDPGKTLGRFLQMAGGDDLWTDRKNKLSVKLNPLILMLLSNELPELRDITSALLNRLSYLEMTRSFAGQENVRLTDELCTELEGIVRWALEGAQRLWKDGRFTVPAYHASVLAETQELCSPPTEFIHDSIEWSPEYSVDTMELQSAYAAAVAGANKGQYSATRLGLVLKGYAEANDRSYARERRKVGGVMRYYYVGLRLRTDAVPVNTVDLENIREWIAAPKEWSYDDEGRRRRQDYSRPYFRISDVLTHALDVPKAQQPREEGRVRRALGALGYTPDDEGRMFLPSAGATVSTLRAVGSNAPSNDTASRMPPGYEDYGDEPDAEDMLSGV